MGVSAAGSVWVPCGKSMCSPSKNLLLERDRRLAREKEEFRRQIMSWRDRAKDRDNRTSGEVHRLTEAMALLQQMEEEREAQAAKDRSSMVATLERVQHQLEVEMEGRVAERNDLQAEIARLRSRLSETEAQLREESEVRHITLCEFWWPGDVISSHTLLLPVWMEWVYRCLRLKGVSCRSGCMLHKKLCPRTASS